MNILLNNLWTIWMCSREEDNDGDNQSGTITHAENFFLAGIAGNPKHQYKALAEIDSVAVKAAWDALGEAEQRRQLNDFDAFVNRHYAELFEAAKKNDRVAFEAVVNRYR